MGVDNLKKRRLTRREKRSRRKKAIIISTLCLLFVMTAGYAAFQTNLSITAKGNIKEPSRVIQSWEQYSNEDFHTDYYRENIVSATFLDTNQVASNATESWDVSEDGKGGVKAWVVPDAEDSTKYDLYIGANGGVIANEDSSQMFNSFITIEQINFNNNFNTCHVTSIEGMLSNCINLTYVDLSSLDSQNITNMFALFSMWYYPEQSQLTTVDLTGWDTSNVTNMRDMFAYNPNLTTIIGLENLNTENVTNMQGLFIDCKSLEKLNLSKWNTNNLTDMNQMFNGCSGLTEINLCSFNTTKVTNMKSLFYNTTKLSVIYVGPNWTTSNADTTSMFLRSGISSVTPGQC